MPYPELKQRQIFHIRNVIWRNVIPDAEDVGPAACLFFASAERGDDVRGVCEETGHHRVHALSIGELPPKHHPGQIGPDFGAIEM